MKEPERDSATHRALAPGNLFTYINLRRPSELVQLLYEPRNHDKTISIRFSLALKFVSSVGDATIAARASAVC